MHVGVSDGDAQTGLQVELAGVTFEPAFCFRKGLVADLEGLLDAVRQFAALDAVKAKGARRYYVVNVAADVKGPFGVQFGRVERFGKQCGMR